MSTKTDIFTKCKPNYKKLITFGFKQEKNEYKYEKFFYNDQFKMVISVDKKGNIKEKVYDTESNEEFILLKVKNNQGKFIGDLKNEYEKILLDIRNKCFIKSYFIYPQTNRITDFIIEKYGSKPEFLWKDCNYGVFRNPKSGKWFGIIIDIDYSKLDKKQSGLVEIINLKPDETDIQKLLKNKGFYPAWHMNKKSWISISLNEILSDDEIIKYIEKSYENTIRKQGKSLL